MDILDKKVNKERKKIKNNNTKNKDQKNNKL